MRGEFDHSGVRMNDEHDVAFAANTITAAYRMRELAKTIASAEVGNDVYLADQCAIVGSFGQWLRLGVIRGEEVYDAKVLSDSKEAIGIALKACARRLPLSEEEVTLLGDMYFHLSNFHENWDSSGEGDEQAFFAISEAEGRTRWAEWTAEISPKASSRFSRLVSSWLKPNA